MTEKLTIKCKDKTTICFESFDEDVELDIWMKSENTGDINIYLSPNQINRIINHLAKQLELIGEPVDILTK